MYNKRASFMPDFITVCQLAVSHRLSGDVELACEYDKAIEQYYARASHWGVSESEMQEVEEGIRQEGRVKQ